MHRENERSPWNDAVIEDPTHSQVLRKPYRDAGDILRWETTDVGHTSAGRCRRPTCTRSLVCPNVLGVREGTPRRAPFCCSILLLDIAGDAGGDPHSRSQRERRPASASIRCVYRKRLSYASILPVDESGAGSWHSPCEDSSSWYCRASSAFTASYSEDNSVTFCKVAGWTPHSSACKRESHKETKYRHFSCRTWCSVAVAVVAGSSCSDSSSLPSRSTRMSRSDAPRTRASRTSLGDRILSVMCFNFSSSGMGEPCVAVIIGSAFSSDSKAPDSAGEAKQISPGWLRGASLIPIVRSTEKRTVDYPPVRCVSRFCDTLCWQEVETRFGEVTLYRFQAASDTEALERPAYVIFRHGLPHTWLPHQIPYRAYADALQRLHCRSLLITTSVGVLNPCVT